MNAANADMEYIDPKTTRIGAYLNISVFQLITTQHF